MSDEHDETVDTFLRRADAVLDEYDAGYVDADAALRQLRGHLEDLREDAAGRDGA